MIVAEEISEDEDDNRNQEGDLREISCERVITVELCRIELIIQHNSFDIRYVENL